MNKSKFSFPGRGKMVFIKCRRPGYHTMIYSGLFHSAGLQQVNLSGKRGATSSDKQYACIYQPGQPQKIQQIPFDNIYDVAKLKDDLKK